MKAILHDLDKTRTEQTIDYVKDNVRWFYCQQHMLLELTAKEISFLLFLTECMDNMNRVTIDQALKKKYCDLIQLVCKKAITEKSLERYSTKLQALGYLLETAIRGYYVVNPRYFFKGPEKDRLTLIKGLITSRQKQSLFIQNLVNFPLDNIVYVEV